MAVSRQDKRPPLWDVDLWRIKAPAGTPSKLLEVRFLGEGEWLDTHWVDQLKNRMPHLVDEPCPWCPNEIRPMAYFPVWRWKGNTVGRSVLELPGPVADGLPCPIAGRKLRAWRSGKEYRFQAVEEPVMTAPGSAELHRAMAEAAFDVVAVLCRYWGRKPEALDQAAPDQGPDVVPFRKLG